MPSNEDVVKLNNKAAKLGLTPEQIIFAHDMALPRAHRRNQEELAIDLGVDRSTLSRWKKNRRVLILVKELMKRYFVDDLPDILNAMKVEAKAGNVQAAKLVIEYVEDYMKRENNINNVTQNNVYIGKDDVKAKITELKNKVIIDV